MTDVSRRSTAPRRAPNSRSIARWISSMTSSFGGTSAVGQKVLEAIFGDQAVRALASRAREDLVERVERLLRVDAARFDALLDEAAPEADTFARLHVAVEAIRRAA